MSEENVAIVRESLEHFAATDDFLNVIAPDFVWDMGTFTGWPDKPQFHGADGLREFVTLWRAPYDDWSMRLEEVHDCGGNRVLALLEQSGKPHGSDGNANQPDRRQQVDHDRTSTCRRIARRM